MPLSEFLAWPQADQDLALAYRGYESRRCGACGHHPDSGPVHAHIDVCPGCVAREKKQKDAKDLPGAHIRLAVGTPGSCERCMTEFNANRPNSPTA